jgi:hypothetical protein
MRTINSLIEYKGPITYSVPQRQDRQSKDTMPSERLKQTCWVVNNNKSETFTPPSSCRYLYTKDPNTPNFYIRDSHVTQCYPSQWLPDGMISTEIYEQETYTHDCAGRQTFSGPCPTGYVAKSTDFIGGVTIQACCDKYDLIIAKAKRRTNSASVIPQIIAPVASASISQCVKGL